MEDFKLKYLKYKLKYLQLKKLHQFGGEPGDINVLYANVGRDYEDASNTISLNTRNRNTNKAFCDYKNGDTDTYETAQITLENLKKCLTHMVTNNIKLLTFNEFCYSKLEDLNQWMDQNDEFVNLDIILIAQNHDDIIYTSKTKPNGYYPQDIKYETQSPEEKILIKLSNPIKNKETNNYEYKDDEHFAGSFVKDSYYKCFGFIYDKTLLEFNEDITRDFIRKINMRGPYTYNSNPTILNGPLQTTITRPEISFKALPLSKNRNIKVIERYDYLVGTLNKDLVSENILQFCAFSSFKNRQTNLDFVLYNTHFSGTLKDNSDRWIKQYSNIIKFIKENGQQVEIFIIGDFNIRSNYRTIVDMKDGVSHIINSIDLGENKFSNYKKFYECNKNCENTLLITKNNRYINTTQVCTTVGIQYNCHTPVTFTILKTPNLIPSLEETIESVTIKKNYKDLQLKQGIKSGLIQQIKGLKEIKYGKLPPWFVYESRFVTDLFQELYDINLNKTDIGFKTTRDTSPDEYEKYIGKLFNKIKTDIK